MPKNTAAKILILAGKGESSSILYNYLSNHFSNIHCIVEEKRNRWKWIKTRARRLGWFTAIAQLLFQIPIPKLLTFFSKKRRKEILEEYELNIEPIPEKIIKRVKSVNSKDVITWITEHQPDLIILNGTRIVSKRVLTSTPVKFVNTHLGITPRYRGVHGGYWAIAQGDSEQFGTTVHLVDEGVDTGNILKQIRIQPTKKDNFSTYPLIQLGAALPLLIEAMEELLMDFDIRTTIPEGDSQLWYHPTIFQYIFYLFKYGAK